MKKLNNQIEVFYGNRGLKQKNLHILRYAEVLLINAEAAANLGLDAMTPLSQVRARAGTYHNIGNHR
ncbi:MAG: RagB/SusD family nutrient uptake outer membrane protein [Ferruginibacter sp.]